MKSRIRSATDAAMGERPEESTTKDGSYCLGEPNKPNAPNDIYLGAAFSTFGAILNTDGSIWRHLWSISEHFVSRTLGGRVPKLALLPSSGVPEPPAAGRNGAEIPFDSKHKSDQLVRASGSGEANPGPEERPGPLILIQSQVHGKAGVCRAWRDGWADGRSSRPQGV